MAGSYHGQVHEENLKRLEEFKQVIDASPMIGGHPGGQIAYTLGIVEFMDGTVGQVSPGYIKFLDTEDFAGDCNE